MVFATFAAVFVLPNQKDYSGGFNEHANSHNSYN